MKIPSGKLGEMRTLLALLVFLVLPGCTGLPRATGSERSDELFVRIQPGMTMEQVRALLGPPDTTMRFSSARSAWDYEYYDTWGYLARFSVTFAGGQAESKISVRLNDGGDHQ